MSRADDFDQHALAPSEHSGLSKALFRKAARPDYWTVDAAVRVIGDSVLSEQRTGTES